MPLPWKYLGCLTTLLLTITSLQAATEVFIGVILSPGDESNGTVEEEAFKLAIDQINADNVNYPDVKLRGLVRYSDPDDDFDNIEQDVFVAVGKSCLSAMQEVDTCIQTPAKFSTITKQNIYWAPITFTSIVNSLLSRNISILIGPMETSAVIATHPLCVRARVPQIAPLTSLQTIQTENAGSSYLLRMSPAETLKAKVIAEIVKHYNWQTMAVLGYQDKEVSKGQSEFRLIAYEKEWNLVVAKLFQPDPRKPRDIVSWFAIKSLQSSDSTRLAVVFCPAWAVSKLIHGAQRWGLDLEKWTWIFSDFGNQEADLLGPSGVVPKNMRGLLGIKPSFSKGVRFQQFKQAWNLRAPNKSLTVSAGRVYDSVFVAAKGIKSAINSGVDLSKPPTYLGFCGNLDEQPENPSGKELARHLNEVRMEGVMGEIQAKDPDSFGSANFDVINLRENGPYKVGEWNERGLQMFKNKTPVWPSGSSKIPKDIPNILKGENLTVTTILAPPFVMRKGDLKSFTNESEEFEGLAIDILQEMRKELGFNYKIYLAPDGKFGVRDRLTGEWNGVVKEIIDKNADLSIAPMTISSDRQTVLDFTQPYMTFGLAYMMRVKDVDANYFRFLSPFHKDLWVAIGVLVMVMSLLLWICSVFSPWGYYGRCLQARSPKELTPEVLNEADTLSLTNSIWSSWKGYVRQGAEHPNSWSGRITVSVFWFAVVIINATYTANLAAHLTVSRMQTPIESIQDLAGQTRIEYGTLKDSQLQTFFQKTDVPSYLVMGQFMEQRKTWMPSFEAAINRTMAGDFAFISDRPILNYVSRQEKYCGKLKVTGGFGNTYGYGFAFRPSSPYTPLFNMALFRLQKDFKISSLSHKWTKEGVKCEMVDNFEKQQQEGSTVQMMTFQGMLGVFILLVISGGVGFLIMIIEWIYASAKDGGNGTQMPRQTCCQACGTRLLRTLRDIFCSKKEKNRKTNLIKEEQ